MIFQFMWTNPNLSDNAVRTELHLSGPKKTTKYLYDLIVEIEKPFVSYDEMGGYVFVYTSTDAANRVMTKLHNELYNRHPELIGHPYGIFREDKILYFRGCEVVVFTHS